MLNGKSEVQGGVNEHWLDRAIRNKERIIYDGNKVRMSAEIILWLTNWRNEMLGIKRPLYEDVLIYEEKNEQLI